MHAGDGGSERDGGEASVVRDHYQVLGVRHDATPEAIKHNYHRLALLLHPDRNPSTSAPPPSAPSSNPNTTPNASSSDSSAANTAGREGLSFQQVQQAWLVLGNAETRATYDAWRKGTYFLLSAFYQINSTS
jgi:curved DNA-binding protein CbpA